MSIKTEFIVDGDSSGAERAFARVGSASQDMARDVDKSSKRLATSSSEASTGIADAVDASEGKFRGLGDVIGGTGDVMDGFRSGNVAQMAMGFADLAGGLSSLVIPALTAMKTALVSGLAPALTLISAHPLIAGILAGGAIIAGLIVLEKKFGLVSAAVGLVKDGLDLMVESLGAVIRGFRDLWNSTIGGKGFDIGGVDLPGPFDIPSFSLRIPKLHTGGVFPGVAGREGLAVLQAGETVNGRGQGGGTTIVVNVSGVGMGRDFGDAVARALRDNKLIGVTI